MSTVRHPPHRWALLLLQGGLVVGALYDSLFALLIVALPELPARLLGLPIPEETYLLWLQAVFLLMLSAFYLLAAYDPVAYGGNVAVAILGRGAGFLVLTAAALGNPAWGGLWPLALADLFFAVCHALAWWPIRRPGRFGLR